MITVTGTKANARIALSGKWGTAFGITFCYFLLEFVLGFITSLFDENKFLSFILSILELLITIPISYGLVVSYMKLKRNEYVSAFDFLTIGLSNFSRAWSVALCQLAKMIIPIILFIISMFIFALGSVGNIFGALVSRASSYSSLMAIGFLLFFSSGIYLFVKGLSLVFSFHIAYDNPTLPAMEACNRSAEIMQGNKGTYFLLLLSYMLWIIVPYILFIIIFGASVSLLNVFVKAFLLIFYFIILNFYLIPSVNVSTICFYDQLIHKNDKHIEQDNNQNFNII